MTIKKEVKRINAGQSLAAFEKQTINAVAQLEAIRINLLTLKASFAADNDFTAADETEVQEVITYLDSRVKEIG